MSENVRHPVCFWCRKNLALYHVHRVLTCKACLTTEERTEIMAGPRQPAIDDRERGGQR